MPPKSVCILPKVTFYTFYALRRRVLFLFPKFTQFLEPNRRPLILVTVQSATINDDHTDSTASEGKYCGMPTCRRRLRHSTLNHITSESGVESLFHLSWKSPAAGSCGRLRPPSNCNSPAAGSCGRLRPPSQRPSCLCSVSPSKPLYFLPTFTSLLSSYWTQHNLYIWHGVLKTRPMKVGTRERLKHRT